jgi:hypothetical protein
MNLVYAPDEDTDSFAEVVGGPGARQEVRNERALLVYNRVQHKLTGSSPRVFAPLCY